MDSVCPEKDVKEILSDSDHSTKVAPTTLSGAVTCAGNAADTSFSTTIEKGDHTHTADWGRCIAREYVVSLKKKAERSRANHFAKDHFAKKCNLKDIGSNIAGNLVD